ncbi:hypothetical protein CK203_088909 [Vitis vinifera]|uniref:Retrovirus-related Pol polyprotein from transposon TNT 1-94-like beta-barrel domain-containing protein n=1 Tax=Vitis vinifera TaxID=29760 RepID=A0A438D0R9_VITVI|nr:hypothetical protein CK203_088909 [Vitis vinifera]
MMIETEWSDVLRSVINSGKPSGDRVSFRSPSPSLNTSDQLDRRQKRLTVGELFPRTFSAKSFSDTDHTKRSAWRRSPTFSKASKPENPPRAGHAHFYGRRLNLTRRRVRAREAFPTTRLLLQPRLTPTSIPTYLVLPSEPCTYLFWGFLSPSALQTAFPAKFRLLSLHPNPCTCLGKYSLPFWCENYLSWSASVELWFMGQGYEDHLVTQEADIPEVDRVQWRKIDAQPKDYTRMISSVFIRWLPAIVHISQQDLDLSTYIGQIASLKEEFLTFISSSLDDVFARLLRISSTQTLPSDSTSDSSVLVSHTTSRGGRSGTRGRGQRPHCTYCNKLGHTRDRCYQLHGRPPRTAHMAQSSDSPLPQPPSSSASQTSQASIASVAQPGNASACLTHTSSLGPWILDSGASDHLSGNKDLFSSITTTSALPTVTLANGSQTVAKGIGLALPLPSLPLTSVLYTPECPFNLISISKITRTLIALIPC